MYLLLPKALREEQESVNPMRPEDAKHIMRQEREPRRKNGRPFKAASKRKQPADMSCEELAAKAGKLLKAVGEDDKSIRRRDAGRRLFVEWAARNTCAGYNAWEDIFEFFLDDFLDLRPGVMNYFFEKCPEDRKAEFRGKLAEHAKRHLESIDSTDKFEETCMHWVIDAENDGEAVVFLVALRHQVSELPRSVASRAHIYPTLDVFGREPRETIRRNPDPEYRARQLETSQLGPRKGPNTGKPELSANADKRKRRERKEAQRTKKKGGKKKKK